MIEDDIQRHICAKLEKRELRDIKVTHSTSATNLYELIGERDFIPLVDNTDWNRDFKLRGDFFQDIRPDIVLRSQSSGENRIIVEVKVTEPLKYDTAADSQIVRYFLHLLAT